MNDRLFPNKEEALEGRGNLQVLLISRIVGGFLCTYNSLFFPGWYIGIASAK
jgi:hypothetical protein